MGVTYDATKVGKDGKAETDEAGKILTVKKEQPPPIHRTTAWPVGRSPPYADSWRVVRRAEELGFSRAWFYDTQMLSADPFVAMAAAAMRTTHSAPVF